MSSGKRELLFMNFIDSLPSSRRRQGQCHNNHSQIKYDFESSPPISDGSNSRHSHRVEHKSANPFSSKLSSLYYFRIFPIAVCSSRINHDGEFFKEESNYSNGDYHTEDDLNLPGVQRKSRAVSELKTVGEFEVNQLVESESGWSRVKYMYRTKSGIFQDEGTRALNTLCYRTAVIGFFLTAIIEGSKHNKAEKGLSRADTKRKAAIAENIIPKKVLLTALKETAKLSALTISLLHLSQTIAAYRNKTSVWEYIASSAIGFGILGLSKGVAKVGVYTLGGAIVGSVGGLIACNLLQNAGMTQEARTMKRLQQEIEKQRQNTD